MKAKIKLLSLVLSIALSGILFTQCVKNEESEGVRAVRQGYAEKLKGDADYQKALAEKERATAEYIRLQAQWEKDEHAAQTELTKLEAKLKEVEVELKKVELEEKKAELEAYKAELETQIAEAKTRLLAAQHAYAEALITNETALLEAKRLLAEKQAELLANDPKLAQYQALYDQLFVTPGYYGQKTTLLGEKLEKQSDIIALKYAVNADHLAWLKRDSVKAAEELKYAKELLQKYESLDGLSVAVLQAKVDEAKIAWTHATVTVAEKAAATLTAQNTYNEENAKYTNEYNKLNDLKNKLTSSVVLVIPDSLYYLNSYSSPSVYPAPISSLVSSVYTIPAYGYKNILNRATGRLVYLKSEDLNSYQANGFGYTTQPSDYEPTKKYLEGKIAYIEDVLAPAVDIQIAEQTAKVAAAKTNLDAGKTAWANAESAYKSQVTAVNNATTALRTKLITWKKAAQDSLAKSSTNDLKDTVAIFNLIKSYYVARYNFDRFVATGTVATYVPNTYAALTAATFTPAELFTNVGAANWNNQLILIAALENASDIKIVNNYEWYDFAGTSIKYSATSPSTNGAVVVPSPWPSATSTVEADYVNSRFGTLLYQSRIVYGASTLDDIHYFLPYDTKKPDQTAAGKSPNFNNYSSSLFALWKSSEDALTTLEENKANTFYVENYKTVLALVNRTIAFYEDLATEYGALVAETEAAVEEQVKVVNAQAKVQETANIALLEAQAVYNTANTHANNLKAVYDLLSNPSTGTLAIIAARITELENKIGNTTTGLIKKVQDANKALADYIAKGNGSDIIADKIAKLEAEIKDIDVKIAALELIIKEIEAKMQALLQ